MMEVELDRSCPLWVALLRQAPFLANLPDRDLMRFAGHVRRQLLKRGEYLFFEEDAAEAFYIVRAGRLKLLKHSDAGRDLIVAIAGPGDQVGVADSLGERYAVTAEVQAPTIVLAFPAIILHELIQENPQASWQLLQLLRAQLADAYDQLKAMATERVEQRLARALLRMGSRSGRRTAEGTAIDPPLSRYDLAQLCGSTTETVSRIISSWQRCGLVSAGRERIVLVDFEGLARMAEEPLSRFTGLCV